MKPSTRIMLSALLAIVGLFWFIGGMLLIALTGGSEGHVSQKSDSARSIIMGVWLVVLLGGAFGVFRLLGPASALGTAQQPPVTNESEKTNAV